MWELENLCVYFQIQFTKTLLEAIFDKPKLYFFTFLGIDLSYFGNFYAKNYKNLSWNTLNSK